MAGDFISGLFGGLVIGVVFSAIVIIGDNSVVIVKEDGTTKAAYIYYTDTMYRLVPVGEGDHASR